jgi:hypothetical protein
MKNNKRRRLIEAKESIRGLDKFSSHERAEKRICFGRVEGISCLEVPIDNGDDNIETSLSRKRKVPSVPRPFYVADNSIVNGHEIPDNRTGGRKRTLYD